MKKTMVVIQKPTVLLKKRVKGAGNLPLEAVVGAALLLRQRTVELHRLREEEEDQRRHELTIIDMTCIGYSLTLYSDLFSSSNKGARANC